MMRTLGQYMATSGATFGYAVLHIPRDRATHLLQILHGHRSYNTHRIPTQDSGKVPRFRKRSAEDSLSSRWKVATRKVMTSLERCSEEYRKKIIIYHDSTL